MKNVDIISFIGNKQSKQKQPKSFEVVLKHDEEVLIEFEIPEVWWSIRETGKPSQHSKFVMITDVAYCLLTKDKKPSNY